MNKFMEFYFMDVDYRCRFLSYALPKESYLEMKIAEGLTAKKLYLPKSQL
jgi:hypothetical protein